MVNVSKLQGDLEFDMLASRYLLDLLDEMLDEAAKVKMAMNDLKLSKIACCSRIEIDNKVHCFVASGKDHLEIREIYAKLDQKWIN